jgi:hypothetical protein
VPGAQPGDEHVGVEDDLRARHAGMIYATIMTVKREEKLTGLTPRLRRRGPTQEHVNGTELQATTALENMPGPRSPSAAR